MSSASYTQLNGKKDLDVESIIVPAVFGIPFGFILVRSLFFLPSVIQGQLQGTDFLPIKFVLSVLATSYLTGSLIYLCGEDSKGRFEASRSSATKGAVSVVLGCMILGVGVALTGATPGSAYAQIGAGIWSGWYVILGGYVAVVAYGFLHKNVFEPLERKATISKNAMDDAFNCQYWHVAIPLGTIMVAFCYFLEVNFTSPWRSEVPSGSHPSDSIIIHYNDGVWSPYICGGLIGLLQIPLRTAVGARLGALLSYISVVIVPLNFICEKANVRLPEWFQQYGRARGLWAAIFFWSAVFGAFGGAFFGDLLQHETGYGYSYCIVGGFLMIFGSCIAGGCPLEIGVSGCSDLNIMSYLGVAVIIGTAASMGMVFKSLDVHPEKDYNSIFS